MSTDIKIKRYKHLGRRVENQACGKLGRIARAERRTDVLHGWRLWISFDGEGSRVSGWWTDRDIGNGKLNRLVADDYVPDHGPIIDRIKALIIRIDEGDIKWCPRHVTTAYVGRDSIGVWRPFGPFRAFASLWAGQGDWEGEGVNTSQAMNNLRKKLVSKLNELQYTP